MFFFLFYLLLQIKTEIKFIGGGAVFEERLQIIIIIYLLTILFTSQK